MSDNVLSYGFIAVLKEPVDHEEFFDKAWNGQWPVMVNYEGTLVYSDSNAHKSYQDRTNIYGLFLGPSRQADAQEFEKNCIEHGLSVDMATIKPYTCIWYNGCDSDMASLTKEKFLKA